MSKRHCACYLRVSTADKGQTVDNQRRDLAALAAQRGWDTPTEYQDLVSGAKGRDLRPGLDRMLKDAARGRFDTLLVWSVDRLGRSLKDLVTNLEDLHAANVALVIHKEAIDTTTPAGKALFGMLGVFSEFERSMIQARVQAGMDRAREDQRRAMERGIQLLHKDGRVKQAIGRPRLSARRERDVMEALRMGGMSLRAISLHTGVSSSKVNQIQRAMLSEAQ
jgi:DNA invertase Pin-like site-specific DNA recombinase